MKTNLEDDDEAEASSGHLVIKQGVVAGRIIAEPLSTEDGDVSAEDHVR